MFKYIFIGTNFFIATRYLLARKKQSLLATLGVLFGVATFIVMINFMTGVNDFLNDAVFNGSPDVIISPKINQSSKNPTFSSNINGLPNIDQTHRFLSKDPNVGSFANQVISPAILISNSQQLSRGLNGVFPLQEDKMVQLERRLLSGEGFKSLNKRNTILIGVSLAKRLQVEVGDPLKVILPNGRTKSLKVSGIFSFGITTIDNVRTYISATTLQELLNLSQNITHINVKLKNRHNVSLKTSLSNAINSIVVEDWKDNNKTIVIGNKVRDILTWSVSFALLLVAGFGIYNILNITVVQKRKDIAVLKTVGYTRNDIIHIFLIQSLIIGLIGASLGLGLGYLISYMISITSLNTDDFIIVDTYPINFNVAYYALGFSFGILTTLLSGYFPSKKASMVDPVTIIRGL